MLSCLLLQGYLQRAAPYIKEQPDIRPFPQMSDMQKEGMFKDLHSEELSTQTGNQENQIILVEGKAI